VHLQCFCKHCTIRAAPLERVHDNRQALSIFELLVQSRDGTPEILYLSLVSLVGHQLLLLKGLDEGPIPVAKFWSCGIGFRDCGQGFRRVGT
jgi:hypothetical protein